MDPRGYLEEAIVSAPTVEVANGYRELKDLHERRLWHNVTLKLVELVELPEMRNNARVIGLYENFIKSFETKLNQLTLAKILVVISKAYNSDMEAIGFLETAATKLQAVEGTTEPCLLVKAIIAQIKLKDKQNLEECKVLLESVQDKLEGIAGVDPSVHSNYYRAQAEYYRLRDRPTEYYRNALQYLSYTPIESLDEEEKRDFAYNLGVAALAGEDTYNFGDLLTHPIVESLKDTRREWLAHLLRAFNQGDIAAYEGIISRFGNELEQEPHLASKTDLLKEKICILCLMEMVFDRQSVDRHIPFRVIAESTKLPSGMDLEVLVMKALSLKLIKGYIDQVDQQVVVTWVQPRVLGIEQIGKMKDRLDDWTKRVYSTLLFMEAGTPDLFS